MSSLASITSITSAKNCSTPINQSPCDKSEEVIEKSVQESSKTSVASLAARPTPPPSGTSSKSVPKKKPQIEQMFETFYQSPNGEFKPTFYNPFEVKHRRRTSRSQFKILERAFIENCKPNAIVRKALAQELGMSVRSIQVWFQNRRAKLKTILKSGKMTEQQMMEYLSSQRSQQQGDDPNHQEQHESPSSFEDSAEDSESENMTPSNSQKGSFGVDRRSFPAGAKQDEAANPVPFLCTSDMIKLGNSYPNQVRNRSYSLPEVQRSPQLPFKQLQEALFGTPQQHQQQANGQETNYYNSSLNAFQNYFRASDAAMNQVNRTGQSGQGYHASSGTTGTSGQITVPLLNNFTPLQQAPAANQPSFEYQVDPNRFRPRSSSFAVGMRSSTISANPGNSDNYEILSVIKEDSPITEYMSLASHQPNGTSYFNNGTDHESSTITNQINSLDLDYFISAANGVYHPHHFQQDGYSNYSSFDGSSSHNNSLASSTSQSPNTNETTSNDYINELSFLPQPTNEILLSTLIDDEHFLH